MAAAGLAVIAMACAALFVVPRPAAAIPLSLAEGARLYAQNCQRCHGDRDGVGKLNGVPSHGADGHTWGHVDSALIIKVKQGTPDSADVDPLIRMPAWGDRLSDHEIAEIIATIKTWWDPRQTEARFYLYHCRQEQTPSC